MKNPTKLITDMISKNTTVLPYGCATCNKPLWYKNNEEQEKNFVYSQKKGDYFCNDCTKKRILSRKRKA